MKNFCLLVNSFLVSTQRKYENNYFLDSVESCNAVITVIFIIYPGLNIRQTAVRVVCNSVLRFPDVTASAEKSPQTIDYQKRLSTVLSDFQTVTYRTSRMLRVLHSSSHRKLHPSWLLLKNRASYFYLVYTRIPYNC